MAKQAIVLTPAESEIIRRVRMTPEQREAERATQREKRLERMTPAMRAARQARTDALAAMSSAERRAHLIGRRLVAVVTLLRRTDTELADVVATFDVPDQEVVTWLKNQLATLAAND